MRHPLPLRLLAACLVALGTLQPAAQAQLAGDVDCNGQREAADVDALVAQLFRDEPPSCTTADVNRDGRIGAADLTALFHGPRMTFVGLASADGRPIPPLGFFPDGTKVVFRSSGFGFNIVIEATESPDGTAAGTVVLDSARNDPARRPDLQVQVERTLGDGSPAVCDEFGIPGVEPVDFSVTQPISDALNDIGCRFQVATTRNSTCTLNSFDQPAFVSARSRVQFCFAVSGFTAFPLGDTGVTIQLRDRSGKLSPRQRLLLRVERGALPSTFTPVPPTETPTPTPPPPTATDTRTRTETRTRAPSPTATATPTTTRIPTGTRTFTRTSSPPVTQTRTRTPTGRTATATTAISRTRTNTPTRSPTIGGSSPTRTRTPTGRTATRTPTVGGPTRTPTRTRTITRTMPPAPTATRTRTPTSTRTASTTPGADTGPVILFFGLVRPDDVLLDPVGETTEGVPIYERPFGFGFSLVVEAGLGDSRRVPGSSTYNELGRPDLQVQVSRSIGNGSTDVCDDELPNLGGIPAVNPPDFGPADAISDRLNDLGCRFVDGSGQPGGRPCNEEESCVRFPTGLFGCVMAGQGQSGTRQQYCAPVGSNLEFPNGETVVTARVRDVNGNLGPPKQVIVRVVPP